MSLDEYESKAFHDLQKRVNELSERVTDLEFKLQTIYSLVPRFIRNKIKSWPMPSCIQPLKYLFDITPYREERWESEPRRSVSTVIPGYDRNRSQRRVQNDLEDVV